jgi:hypothetical protein
MGQYPTVCYWLHPLESLTYRDESGLKGSLLGLRSARSAHCLLVSIASLQARVVSWRSAYCFLSRLRHAIAILLIRLVSANILQDMVTRAYVAERRSCWQRSRSVLRPPSRAACDGGVCRDASWAASLTLILALILSEQVAQRNGIPLVDSHAVLQAKAGATGALTTDGRHLTQSGYALLASAVRCTAAAARPGPRYDCLLATVSPMALGQAHRAMHRRRAIHIPRNSARCSTMTTVAALEYNLLNVPCS